jgi:hypothetical protein
MRAAAGLFITAIMGIGPSFAQDARRPPPYPSQEECPQGRQIRAQKAYPSTMTDCQVLDADTAAENQKLPRRAGGTPNLPAQPPGMKAPEPQESEAVKTARQIAFDLSLGYSSISVDDFLLDAKDLATSDEASALVERCEQGGIDRGISAPHLVIRQNQRR